MSNLREARQRAVILLDEMCMNPEGSLHFLYADIKHLSKPEQILHIAGFLLYRFKKEVEAVEEFSSALNESQLNYEGGEPGYDGILGEG